MRHTAHQVAAVAVVVALALAAESVLCGVITLTKREVFPVNHRDDSADARQDGEALNLAVNQKVQLNNFANMQYYAQIQLGSQKQKMNVIFDTGSHLLWVPTVDCGKMCHDGPNRYNYSASTYSSVNRNNVQHIKYGSGECQGYMGKDLFQIAGTSIAVMHDILFVNQDKDLQGLTADGILGLSNLRSTPNFLDLAYRANQIKSNVFALQIGTRRDRSEVQQSFLYFDDIPPEITDSTVYVSATRQDYWNIPFTGIEVDGTSYTKMLVKRETLIDSGTSFILLDQALFSKILNDHLSRFCTDYQYTVLCVCDEASLKQYPDIKFYSNNVLFVLKGKDYVIRTPSYCMLGISVLPGQIPFYIFGDTFMRNFVVTYDKNANRMGFTNTLDAANQSGSNSLMYIAVFVFIIVCCFTVYAYIKFKRDADNELEMRLINDQSDQRYRANQRHGNNMQVQVQN